ncbi:MAG: YvcK family protein [Tissierellia bacterium]|nr:YvcK family protein [Tissierellia bacterium]
MFSSWLILSVGGVVLFLIGLSSFLYKFLIDLDTSVKIILTTAGIILTILSIRRYLIQLSSMASTNRLSGNTVLRDKILSKGPKVVVIGGGTGLSVLLRGLKEYTSNITAIVTVADDGGGSGILREDLGMLPPGDIRSCILALANTEPIMEKLLQYRFNDGMLKGQSFGNLFIAAMNEICGSFEEAIKETSNVLAVTGKVLPMTLEDVTLYAVLENGHTVKGESAIPLKNKELDSRIKQVYMEPRISYPLVEAVEAIQDADLIVLGPGSLYTSVIPNLLVNGMVKTIYHAEAPKVYIANIMTQPGETDGYTVLDHVDGILTHSRDDLLDYVIVNTEKIPRGILERYTLDGSEPVILKEGEEDILKSKGIQVIKENLVDIKKDYIRHDALKLSRILVEIGKKKIQGC